MSTDNQGENHKKKDKSADAISRIVAIIALIMSGFTFLLQFVAHDAISYKLSQVRVFMWPTDFYVAISLNIFNEGNRSAALISATAERLEKKPSNDKSEIANSECTVSASTIRQYLFPTPDEKTSPALASLYSYASVVEPGKMITKNLIFSIFGNNINDKSDKEVEGVICLKLQIADSQGRSYYVTKTLGWMQAEFKQTTFQFRQPEWFESQEAAATIVLTNKRRIEFPF